MYFAEISDTGQIVVPVEIRKLLKLKAGDNILFQLTFTRTYTAGKAGICIFIYR